MMRCHVLGLRRHLSQQTRALTGERAADFFGIQNITNKDIAGCFASSTKLSQDKLADKYTPLTVKRNKPANEEECQSTSFGQVRLDQDNIPTVHGQYDLTNSDTKYTTTSIKQTYVDVYSTNDTGHPQTCQVDEDTPSDLYESTIFKVSEVPPAHDIAQIFKLFEQLEPLREILKYSNTSPLTYQFNHETLPNRQNQSNDSSESVSADQLHDQMPLIENMREDVEDVRPKLLKELEKKYEKETISEKDLDPMSLDYHSRMAKHFEDVKFDRSMDQKYDVDMEPTEAIKGLKYIKDIRSGRVEPVSKKLKERLDSNESIYSLKPRVTLDSKGYHVYTYQTPDWNALRHVDLVNHIKSQIIYNNYDILAVNKPYGIASHNETGSRVSFDMNSLVKEVAKSMRISNIYLAHRLDKFTTGVLLFATSQTKAHLLNKLFKSDEIKKTYWCITKGVPDPATAVIDIPIGEFKTAGKLRSCLAPEKLPEDKQLVKRYREARRAITEYTVINSKKKVCALVEVRPRSGIKHQIRCHLAFGLGNPILGDHKYSSLGKVAPQKLCDHLLKDLNLRQSKVRTLPLHLHAKTIVIPGAKANGETLFINAPLPYHFVDNMKRLKLINEEIKTRMNKQ